MVINWYECFSGVKIWYELVLDPKLYKNKLTIRKFHICQMWRACTNSSYGCEINDMWNLRFTSALCTKHRKMLVIMLLSLTLKAPITTAADDKFWYISQFSTKIRYDITWELSASRRYSWNIMPYLLFLKKRQNL